MPTLYAKLPDGQIASRTTNRKYTHVVAMRRSYEQALKAAREPSPVSVSNYNYHVRESRAETAQYLRGNEDAAAYFQSHLDKIAGCANADEYVEKMIAEAVAKVEECRKAGYYDTFGASHWCGSRALAEKQASPMRSDPYYAEVVIVEVLNEKPEEEKPVSVKPAKVKKAAKSEKPAAAPAGNHTKAAYDAMYAAFDHFNAELFDGRLPAAMLVLHRKRNAHGYFWANRWFDKVEGEQEGMHEIALNPASMGRDLRQVLSTLAHEMVHHEQEVFGKPSPGGHNKEWAEWMDRIGLTPTSTGLPDGKRTGRRVTHMIVDGGAYDVSFQRLVSRQDVDFSWFSPDQAKAAREKDMSKVKHTCACGCNIWGAYGKIEAICGHCDQPFEAVGV